MTPSRLHPLSVVHFQATLFQTKGQTKPNRAQSVLFLLSYLGPIRGSTSGVGVCLCVSPAPLEGSSECGVRTGGSKL